MKRIKLKEKNKTYSEGVKCFDRFIKMNRVHIDKMKDEGKEMYLFLAGYYAKCKRDKGE